jgi:hypothetical protein
MNRRLFMAVVVAAGAATGWDYWRRTPEQSIAAILYKRLAYLKLDHVGVQRFAADFAARHVLSNTRLRVAGLLWPLYRRLPLTDSRWASHVNHAEERIVSTYLISTDFFTGGSDQTKTVRYLGCYDALTHACGNPFCRAVEV